MGCCPARASREHRSGNYCSGVSCELGSENLDLANEAWAFQCGPSWDGRSWSSRGSVRFSLEFSKQNFLGGGALGAVHRGSFTGRSVAAKTYFALLHPEEHGLDASDLDCLVREAVPLLRRAAALKHEHVVELIGVACRGPSPWMPAWILTSAFSGGTVHAMIHGEQKMAPVRVEEIGRMLAAGLAYIHGQGVTHTDIRPKQLLVRKDGRIAITNVGTVTLARRIAELTGVMEALAVRSYAYLSPEGPASREPPRDVFAAGCVLGEALLRETMLHEHGARQEQLVRAAQVAELEGQPDLKRAVIIATQPEVVERASAGDMFRIQAADEKGRTVLHRAALRGDSAGADSLLQDPCFSIGPGGGSAADVQDSRGFTALHLAAQEGHHAVVGVILKSEKFSAFDAVDQAGQTALHCAVQGAGVALCKAREYAVQGAVDPAGGHKRVMRDLLDHPHFHAADAQDERGETALHIAARSGSLPMIRLLLDHPRFGAADTGTLRVTGLHGGVFDAHASLVKFALASPRFAISEGCDAAGFHGLTALHVAAYMGRPEEVVAILEHPRFTAANAQDRIGFTALHAAVVGQHVGVIHELLKHPQFTAYEVVDIHGQDPEMLATKSHNHDMIKLFMLSLHRHD